jgi:hypothetical protein
MSVPPIHSGCGISDRRANAGKGHKNTTAGFLHRDRACLMMQRSVRNRQWFSDKIKSGNQKMNGLQPYMIGPHRKTLLLLRLQLLPSILSPHFIKT